MPKPPAIDLQGEGSAIFRMQRFGQPQGCPDRDGQRDRRHEDEDHVPFRKQHHELADARRDDRDDHEHHEDQRHDLGHGAAAEDVADDRNGDDARRSRADALDEAKRKQRREARRERRAKRRDDIDAKPEQQRRAPAEPVGDRAVDELRKPEARRDRPVITYCRWFSFSTPRLAPICCRPGSMMSMASALSAISAAASAMNSQRGSGNAAFIAMGEDLLVHGLAFDSHANETRRRAGAFVESSDSGMPGIY